MKFERAAFTEELSTFGDLPFLESLLDQGHGITSLESELYSKYRQEGKLEGAKMAVSKLQEGVDYAKALFPKVKPYIDRKLSNLGYKVETYEKIDDPKIIPLRLPSRTIEGEIESEGRKEQVYGFSGAAAGVTCYRCNTPEGYLMFANLPLAHLSQEDVNPMGLHEYIHIYLSKLGISDEKQKSLEPYIDTWVVGILHDRGEHELAEKYRRNSGYLNRPSYIV